jgi:sugar lactone lactonase YvrE
MPKKVHMAYEVAVNSGCHLGEGPVWDSRRREVLWVDILKGAIHVFDVTKNTTRKIEVNDLVGAVVLSSDGNLIAALRSGIARVDRDSGKTEMLVHPEEHVEGNRYNDGKCDPSGRFWIGSMALSEEDGKGNLHMIKKDLSSEEKLSGVSISNGLAWTTDRKTLYYIDSPTLTVVAYDYDDVSGNISNKRVVINVPKQEGFPDGMTIDSEGKLWIGHWDGWQLARWDPISGEKMLSLSFPVARITSCTFGGENLDDLYVTSARVGLSEKELAEQPLAGALFKIKNSGFKGMPAVEFDFSPKIGHI